MSFELFKSNTQHLLKSNGDILFLQETLCSDRITTLFDNKDFACAFYLLALTDYISNTYHIPLYNKYDYYRCGKLNELLIPPDLLLLQKISSRYVKDCYANAIPEFLRYNILEVDVYNAI